MKILKPVLLTGAVIILVLVSIVVYFATDIFARNPEMTEFKNIPVVQKSINSDMEIQFIRHATVLIIVENKKILVDPMLGEIGTESPYPMTANRIKNPLISMPVKNENLIKDLDAVLLTHYHPDHFDKTAENILPKDLLIYCQPGDDILLKEKGFVNVQVIDIKSDLGEISIMRYEVNHAEGIWEGPMGKSSAYFLKTENDSLLISGDTIYDKNFENVLNETQPNLVIANAGAAQFIIGTPITLTADALKNITKILPNSKIFAVHMDAINHCVLLKDDLRKFVAEEGLTKSIFVPNEGGMLSIK
ncbi:MAG: MBL fold metallo-hydrolase [Candidatus Cloacimonetes bacterium]|nr:MBL fold metallo-hydrolase [Candidatus Cloacimonadota bacterium]